MDQKELGGILQFLREAENLKNTLRSAYSSQGRHESAAEHSWRLALMVLLLGPEDPRLNLERLLKMAVIHDLGEAICGDISAVDQSGADKSVQERLCFEQLLDSLPEQTRCDLLDLWDEYEMAQSPEASFLKGLDKLETITQHNQGKNPPGFDYAFNLAYGKQYTDAHPLLRQLREEADAATRVRMAESEAHAKKS